MAPQYDQQMANDRRDAFQVAYPASLERRKDANQRSGNVEANRQADADRDDNELYFGDS